MIVKFFANGNTLVTGDKLQHPHLQKAWIALYIEFLASQGHDPEDAVFWMPDNSSARVFRTDSGYNWEVI